MNTTGRRRILFFFVFSLASALIPAVAEHHEGAPGGMEMTPEMQQMMALAQPGPEHEFFEHFLGSWKYESTMWMEPSAEPMITLGESTGKMILGGRFLQTEYRGDFMGMPFQGLGIDGYDRVAEKFVSVWMDNMGTMMIQLEGSLDKSGKVLTMHAEFLNPMNREVQKVRSVTTILDDKSHKFQWFGPGPDGKEFLTMEMHYTRP
jgi:hypothetical protein